jgi:hypothetical protein
VAKVMGSTADRLKSPSERVNFELDMLYNAPTYELASNGASIASLSQSER